MSESFEFDALCGLTGPTYEAYRDKWLPSLAPQKARLAQFERDPDWKTSLMSRVVSGWIEHGSTYKKVLSDIDSENVAAAQQSLVGLNLIWNKYATLAEEEYGPTILPLCWESTLKHAADWPDWKLITMFKMMGAVPSPHSVDPLMWYIAETEKYPMADAAAQALLRQDRELIRTRIEKASTKYRQILEILEEASEEIRE